MNTLMPPPAEMERAYLRRDASYNGVFFLGVRTTGIFCRPTCPARKPLPKNVEYFASAGRALAAGYRPCRRCLPLALDDQPAWAAELIAAVEDHPSKRLSEADLRFRGVDPGTVRRYFLSRYGMTFHAYARSRRLTGALSFIREGGEIDDAVYESGYDSHSGFREAFARAFGSPPGASREKECVLLAWMKSPLGPLVAGATAAGVCLVEYTDRRMLEAQIGSVRRVFGAPVIPGSNAHLDRLQEEMASYFAGSLRRFSVPLTYPGTPFQGRVWTQLLAVPYGETRSYEEMAAAVGQPRAVRAVGRANGLNRIAIVIPCHRIVNKDGHLCGYGGGLWRKQYLLDLERRRS
ncbi:MAG TPA: methylated-DNA--[protein]-cysteine S-methyltransferase [Candidatus Polarisedimenticolia bacterium]|jgi:AraC family transcriptional regulator of adaptative response/methylated-DNA-[protein]-cysteine methyltransferase|nr:methylated-DNA--[protein]-cysteine S-methyltransferase [Candidatus Polarisedimenticolia bacterium]